MKVSYEERLADCFGPRRRCDEGNDIVSIATWRDRLGHGGVGEPVHAWTFQTREPGDPIGDQVCFWSGQGTTQWESLIGTLMGSQTAS